MSSSIGSRVPVATRVVVDAATYVVAVAAVATALALVVALVTGGGFVRAKALLFLGGFVLMAYATVQLWPSSPADLETESGLVAETGRSIPGPSEATRFQAAVRRLPPLRWIRLPSPEQRLAPAAKLFWSSVAVLLVSFAMEVVFGVV